MSVGLIGPVVGAIAEIEAGASGAMNTGGGYDVAIGDQMFKLAINDKNTYQRATAQFRKDQLDSAATPGDQSLTGWWTRGQLSFHKGAGVNYYEVSEGETVLNRYKESTGINPFEPGRVTLCPDWTDATGDTHSSTTYVAPVGDNLVVLDEGTVYYGPVGDAGDTFTPSGASVLAAAVGNGDIYTANTDQTISRIGLAETVTTIYPEQGFESSVDSWFTNGALGHYAAATSVATSGTQFYAGTKSLKTVWPAPGGTDNASWVGRNIPGLTVGKTYTMVAKVFVPTGDADIKPIALFAAQGSLCTTKNSWTTVHVTFTAYSADFMYVGFLCPTPVAGDELYVDKVVVYEGTATDYATGDIPLDVIYSHTERISGLFYAKDRLFMVDSDNTFYQLAPNPSGALPVSITASDKVFTVGGDQSWCLTDTPGPVLLANNNRIFAVTVDSSGAIPTLSGPIQVADLPLGESVRAMAHHLGFLVIVTTAGTRIGIVTDGGTVTYGPLLFEWDDCATYTSISRKGSRAVVAGGHALYEIDLAEQIGNSLEFGYCNLPSPFTGTEVNYGASIAPDLSVVAWSDSDTVVQSGTELTSSGTLTTGFHRFATLEPKRFASVKLRVTGTGGTVAVARVAQDGTVTPLYTLDVSSDDTAEVGLGLTTPAEAVGLKFTLSRDGSDATNGPTLLGYQLRALPEPQRQRLIRVPLLIQDVERRQPARASGHGGSAWARLRDLEDLESSGTPVLYRDFRTGESASVYIESVEFSNETPPSAKSAGFGGTAFLTLRKL